MSNIRVALRVRPLSEKEKDDGSQEIVQVNGNAVRIENVKVLGIQEFGDTRARIREFVFDHCYNCMHGDNALSSQAKVFEDLGTQVLKAAFDGFNACVFAYGQTGTGKTHTMMGYPGDVGLIPRICEGLFTHMSQRTDENITSRIDISYFEIYNERVRDLLQPELLKVNENYSLKVREHPKEGPYVKDLSWHRVKNNEDIQALLDKGNEYRVTAETYMHGHSSRSHAIVTVCYTQAILEENRPSEIVSKVNLVDLAGSERADPSSKPDFRKRLTEGANINKSLVTLGYVIKALAERSLLSWATEEMGSVQNIQSSAGGDTAAGSSPAMPSKQRVPYIPYRDSVLTWLLKDSLGGNSKTIMIATITPASQYYSESISTLRYAQRAKNIINKPRINEDSNVALIRELRREIERLQEMLASAQMGGNLVTLQESEDSIIAERLHENEEMAKQLTQSWMCKWSSTHDIMKESDLSIRGLRNRSSSMGVMIDSQLPYLVGMDDDVLSTGIVIFHLKEGDTLVGREDAEIPQDIVLHGPTIQTDHCVIRHINGEVYLHPCPGALCVIQGIECTEPTKLTQGDYVVLGGNQVFRFNNPSEAAKLRENRRSQGSLNALNTSHLSFGGLSRASSYSSIGGDDSSYLSPQSQFGRSYPNPSRRHSDIIIRDLEKRYQTEQERIEETKRELEKLKAEHEKAEELRQLKEEEMYQTHEQHRAEIEEQKLLLQRQIEENERARAMAEEELQLARESLSKEKEAFQKQLEEERRKLKELQRIEQQQESMAIQTDPLSTQSTSVGSDPLSTQTTSVGSEQSSACETSVGDDDGYMTELPVKHRGGRKLSACDQLEELAQTEFTRRMSYRETEESLAIQQEDIEDAYQQTQEQIQERMLKIQKIEEEYKEVDKAHLQEISAHTEKVREIRKKEIQLEVYIQENEELINVGKEKPRPLRSACSEMFLLDPSIEDQEYSQKTTSLLDIQGELTEEQEKLSPRSRPLRRSSSAESLESSISEISKDQNMESDQQKKETSRKISSVAKEVTSRLYKAPEPKFKYVPKVKEKEVKTIPRTKTYRNCDSNLRSSPTKAVRDFDRSKSESPQRVSTKRASPLPGKDVDPKRRSASAPQRDPKSKVGPKTKFGDKADKPGESDSKIMAVRNKTQGPNKSVSPTSRLGGALSPERLSIIGPSIARTSPSSLRHMTSASSLASVPESLAENEDSGVNEYQNEQDFKGYVVKKRQKKGRANFIDDDFRCHSAPDSQRTSQAFDEYRELMNMDNQYTDRVVPLVTASVSVDESVMLREEEEMNKNNNATKDDHENGKSAKESEQQAGEYFGLIDNEQEMKEMAGPSVQMYISSEDESRCIDDMEMSEESENCINKAGAEHMDKASVQYIEASDIKAEISSLKTSEILPAVADSAVSHIPLETESSQAVTLGKRERKDSDKFKETNVPAKKSKSDTSDKSESDSEVDADNFSEDSLDLNISIDSLEGEKQINRLTQSLPAYLIRSEKPMSEDSLSDSFDEQNKDSLDSDKTDKDKDTALNSCDRQFVDLSQKLESSEPSKSPHSEGIENLSVSKLSKLSFQEPITSLPSESSESTDTNKDDSEQNTVNDALAVTPVNETSLISQLSPSSVPDSHSESTNLTNTVITSVERDTSDSEVSDTNDRSDTLENNDTESNNINEAEKFNLKNDEKINGFDHKGESGELKKTDISEIKKFVSDIIQHAQEICLQSSESEQGKSIQDESYPATFQQVDKGVIEATSDQGKSIDSLINIELKLTDIEMSPERNEVSDIENYLIDVSPAVDEGLNIVVGNLCEEMLQDVSVENSLPSRKDNELNRESEQKSLNVDTCEVENPPILMETEVLNDSVETANGRPIEGSERGSTLTSATEDIKIAVNKFESEEQNRNKQNGDKDTKKRHSIVDENHNVIESEIAGELETESGMEPVQSSGFEGTVNTIEETVPVSEGNESCDFKDNKAEPEDNSVTLEIENENFPDRTEEKSSLTHPHEDKQMNDECSSENLIKVTSLEFGEQILYEPSNNEEQTELREKADTAYVPSALTATRTVGVGTSQELLDSLDDVMLGDNYSQGSNDSFLLDPREELQALQEALEKLPARQPAGPQLSTARRAARQRAMIRQQHRGADSDGVAQLSDEAPVSGTQTKNSSRPNSGSRRRKRPANKASDKSTKHLCNRSSDDYGSSENNSVYSDDSIDAVRPENCTGSDTHNGQLFTNGENEDLVFYASGETADMLSGPKQKHHGQHSPGSAHQRQDYTEVVDGPDGRRTVGIQTFDHSLKYRSTGSARTDLSDLEISFASEGRGMVMSPLSLWNSNERSGSESHSDRNSTSSAGIVKHLNDFERSMPTTPRTNTSLFSDRSNLEKGPTEVWSSSSSELQPLPSFRDDLSYIIETEGMSPGASSLDYTEDEQSQHSSVYMRTPREGERLIPRPDCSTPSNSGRTVSISFPESQLQQAAKLEADTPVKFQVTVHEDNTNIEYNVGKTEYKTYALRNHNEPNIIPDRILVNMTENTNSQSQENYSTQHREEIKIYQPDKVRSPEDSLVLEKSYKSSSSSERDMKIDNDEVKKDDFKEQKDETEVKSNYYIPSNAIVKEPVVKKKGIKLQHSGVVEATSYPGITEEAGISGNMPTESGPASEETTGASLSESEYTSDYGTITSIDGRKGHMSFASDSEDGESFAISPRPSNTAEQTDARNQKGKQQTEYLPVHNEFNNLSQNAATFIPEEGQSICSTANMEDNVTVIGIQERPVISQAVILQNDSTDADKEDEVYTLNTEPPSDFGYDSMKQVIVEGHAQKGDLVDEELETDTSSVDTVRQVQAGESQNFCSQETLDDVKNMTGNHENVELNETDPLQSEAKVPMLDLMQSPVCSPQRQQKLSCSSTDDTYVSLDQSESNTSTCSSDYKTPQQSPREHVYDIISHEVDDVVIPDYCSVFSQSTPRQKAEEINLDQAPVLTSSPKQSHDVRTVSVNTESVPSTTLSAPPTSSKVRHMFSKDPIHTEALRRDLEKKIAKLQHHVRSLSDSAISSDFTDGDSSSLSPRGSRVYDDKVFLGEKKLAKVYRNTQSPTRVKQVINFEGAPSTKVPFKDSGNVFDDDDNEKLTEAQIQSLTFQEIFLPVTSPVGIFPERLIDALLAIKPQPLQRCHSLDSLSSIINLKPHLSRAVREFQSVEKISSPTLKTAEMMETAENVDNCRNTMVSSNGGRPLSPGEIALDQESIDDMYEEMEKENIIPETRLPIQGRQNFKNSEKSTSMSVLGDNLPDREYHRSLSEGNIDDFGDVNDNLDSSNDSITFVFIKDNRTKPTDVTESDNNECLDDGESYDPCGSGEMYESDSQSSDSIQMSPGEYYDRDQPEEDLNISGRGNPSPHSEDRISDVLSLSGDNRDVDEDQVSTHTASEEIEEIICQNENFEQFHGSRDIGISCQTDSPVTYTDTSESFVQSRGKHYDEDSEPLRHKFGIDESVLPIPERSVSADNIPKKLMPLKEIMRSRSTGMLDVGVADEQESESGIFPPALKADDDPTEQSVSLNTMSDGVLDSISQRTFSDIEPSLSNQTSGDIESENSNSADNSSAVVRSICSRSSSVESIEEDFIIDFKTNWKKPEHKHSVNGSASSEGEIEAELIEDEQQQIRKVLETVQKLIMPKPATIDRGMTTDSETGSNLVSVGIQAPSPTSDLQSEHAQTVLRPDQIILPALAAPFRAQSMDSFGLGANGQGLELSEGSRNWCTLGELMIETTQLLRRINDRLPEQDRKGSVSSDESQASQVILKKWQEISIQTGQSIENLTSIGCQTEGDDTVTETVIENKENSAVATQVDRKLKMKPLEKSDTITHEVLPFTACEIYVQTDETGDMSRDEEGFSNDTDDNVGKQKSVLAEAVVPILLSEGEQQPNTSEQIETSVTPLKSDNPYEMPSKTTAKFISQVKAELGFEQRKSESDAVAKADSPRRQEASSIRSLQSPTRLLPGFTLPDTPEIVELRKEHAKLMENLRKASDDRSSRTERLQARKKTAAIEDSQEKMPVEGSLTAPISMLQCKKVEKESSAGPMSNVKFRGPNKNDPETDTSSESGNTEETVRSDDEDRETLPEKEIDEETVRSDTDDKEPSRDYIQDVIRSDGEDEKVNSDNEKVCDDEDDEQKHLSDSESPSSTQEFIQINIQADPNTGVTVENKRYRELSPARKPGKSKDKILDTKKVPVHMKEEHTWAITGDEFKTVWERRPESRARTESNSSKDTEEPCEVAVMPLEDQTMVPLSPEERTVHKYNETIASLKQVQDTHANENLGSSRSESKESLNSVIEETVVPRSHCRDLRVPELVESKSYKGESEERDSSKDSVFFEETIIPVIYNREERLPQSFLNDEGEIPESEPESVTADDPRERGPKLPKQIIKCETSPKYKVHILREQQRQAASPELTDSLEQGPEDETNILENTDIPTQKSDVLHTKFPKKVDSAEKSNKLLAPGKDVPDHASFIPLSKETTVPPRFADDATQMSVEFSDDCTQTDTDSPIEPVITPTSETKNKAMPNNTITDTGDPSKEQFGKPKGTTTESPDTQTTKDMKEELEDLQHERQHIMDLLGLSYLPNSLTVELLEAKLNHCIGQTDLLLENLENSIDPEEAKKPTAEQKQAKDYISKYRADLKKSKQDIKECREQLNKGRGRGLGSGRGRTPFRRRDIYLQQRQAEIDAFKLERMREQQDYERSGHAYSSRHTTPSKANTPLKGNTPLRGNTPLYGNSPAHTPRSDRSRSSSPSYSPSYMNPKEHKAHLVDLRRQLIKDVVEEEKQHSRSCSPTFHTSPALVPKQRSPSEQSLGFSPKVSVSLSDVPGSPSSSPTSQGSKTYVVAPGSSSLSPVRRPASYDPVFIQPRSPYSSYQNSPDRAGVGRRTSPANLDRHMMSESLFSPQESQQILQEIEAFKKRTPNISAPIEELLRRSSFSSTSSQRSSSSRPDIPNLSPRSQSDTRLPGRNITSPVARQLNNPLSLNLDCLQDDEAGPYSPYSAYAREHLIPSERSPPGGVLRGTYELYQDRSDTSSILSYDSDTFSDSGQRPRHNTLDEDTIKRLRPIRAEDIKARINRHKR